MSSDVRVHAPRLLGEALGLLAERPMTVLAGGTDLMVFLQSRAIAVTEVLDVWHVDGLRFIRDEGDALVIGALTTYTDIISSPLVREHLPALVLAARLVGAVQIQNRGTIGGNLGNASPAADTPPALLAAGGSVRLASAGGTRDVDLDAFFLGYRRIDRRPDELISEVRCKKRTPAERDWFRKVGTRRAQAISKVVLGGRARIGPDGALAEVRLAAGSVAPTVVRLRATEAALTGLAPSTGLRDAIRAGVAADITPIDDVRSTADYRRAVTANVIASWVASLARA